MWRDDKTDFVFVRNDGATLLYGLHSHAISHTQSGHLKVLRPRHLSGDRLERHHHGYGVLYDAYGNFSFNLLFIYHLRKFLNDSER